MKRVNQIQKIFLNFDKLAIGCVKIYILYTSNIYYGDDKSGENSQTDVLKKINNTTLYIRSNLCRPKRNESRIS